MSDQPINLTGGIPTTELPEPESLERAALDEALAADDPRAAVSAIVAGDPRSLDGWAAQGDLGRDVMDRYAAYRVGYHRGLDALRANGWRGSGYVRWSAPGNQGFLHCLLGLHLMATEIGEDEEAARCAQFLMQLDPSGVPEQHVAVIRRS
jgi:hypothetical protein